MLTVTVEAVATAAPLPTQSLWPSSSPFVLAPLSPRATSGMAVAVPLGALPAKAASSLLTASDVAYYSFTNPGFGGFQVSLVAYATPAWSGATLAVSLGGNLANFAPVQSCTLTNAEAESCTFLIPQAASYYIANTTYIALVTATGPLVFDVVAAYFGETPPPPRFTAGSLVVGAPPLIQTASALTWNTYRFVARAAGAFTISLTTIFAACGWAGVWIDTLDDTHPASSDFAFPTYRWFAGATPTGSVVVTTLDPYYQVC